MAYVKSQIQPLLPVKLDKSFYSSVQDLLSGESSANKEKYLLKSMPTIAESDNTFFETDFGLLFIDPDAGSLGSLVLYYESSWKLKAKGTSNPEERIRILQYMKKTLIDIAVSRLGHPDQAGTFRPLK